MKLPPLNALRAFETVARHLSFSRAGDELSITHSAVSHQIKRIEQWLGRPLFDRNPVGVTLTPAGTILSQFLTPSFMAMAELCARLKTEPVRPVLTIGCIPSIASRWLIPNLPDFANLHPDIEIQVQYATAQQRFSPASHDVLITLGEDGPAAMSTTKLFSRANRPVCSPHYLARHGKLDTPLALSRAQLLHDETRQGWEEWFRVAGAPQPEVMTGPVFQDFNLLATALIAGHGVALCPTAVFRAELEHGDLVIVSDIETQSDKSYFMITDSSVSRQTAAFTAWFAGVAAVQREEISSRPA
ncbi:LysR substrate-binding domain-containing protein [Pararhizobium sp.]|uniref:LysR substrate-binding domain-containing protein n=1 Tax=Pararhizobium sp. TaxID=1977563 RepID=UPI002715EABA|nr:LysR substrate-binding domain-containing protein [Pararhizobium sp.]MDO9417756.1 LysR substrate-binding domain-containing protein [Pararhizobium sp.]